MQKRLDKEFTMPWSLRRVRRKGYFYCTPPGVELPQCQVLLKLEEERSSTRSGPSRDFIHETTTGVAQYGEDK